MDTHQMGTLREQDKRKTMEELRKLQETDTRAPIRMGSSLGENDKVRIGGGGEKTG